jgi:hypothetical protein
MSDRGRSTSPKPLHDADVDMENGNGFSEDKKDVRVVVLNGLSRNVAQAHLQTIFGFYGEIIKIDLPLYTKCRVPILLTWSLISRTFVQLVKIGGKLHWSMEIQCQHKRPYPI